VGTSSTAILYAKPMATEKPATVLPLRVTFKSGRFTACSWNQPSSHFSFLKKAVL
jgi:hypothetical protein